MREHSIMEKKDGSIRLMDSHGSILLDPTGRMEIRRGAFLNVSPSGELTQLSEKDRHTAVWRTTG